MQGKIGFFKNKKRGDELVEILFFFFLLSMLTGMGGTSFYLTERRYNKRRTKHKEELKTFIHLLNEDKLVPVLKERNITNFEYKENDIKLHVAYNQKTIYVRLFVDVYHDSDEELLYVFEYDIEKDFLVYTDRESYTYEKHGMYNEINSQLSLLTQKIIDVDWDKKSKEPIQTQRFEKEEKKDETNEFENLRNKTKIILKHFDLIEEDEKKRIKDLIENEFEKTISFYNKMNKDEMEKYKPVIQEKLKDIEKELEQIIEKIEERKYQAFKTKLRKLSEEENQE